MNQFATFLKVGIASLVLAAIEDPEVILRDYTMENPAQVIRDVSYDLWNEKPISLANGRKMTAWEIQDELCQTLEAFVANRDFTDDYHTAFTEWRSLLHDYQRDPMSLRDRVDWVAKYEMMSREMSRSNTSWDDPKVALIDLMYHDTHPTRGLFYRYESRGLARTVVSTDAVTRAKETAPSTTRAALRGSFIAEATKWQRDFTVDWVHLKLNDEMQRTVLLKDPFKTFDPRFDDLLQSLQRPPSTNLTS
jgi:proteasome accessory factor A